MPINLDMLTGQLRGPAPAQPMYPDRSTKLREQLTLQQLQGSVQDQATERKKKEQIQKIWAEGGGDKGDLQAIGTQILPIDEQLGRTILNEADRRSKEQITAQQGQQAADIQRAASQQGQPGTVPGVNLAPTPGGAVEDVGAAAGAAPPVQGPPRNAAEILAQQIRGRGPVPLQSAALPGAQTPATLPGEAISGGAYGQPFAVHPQSQEQQQATAQQAAIQGAKLKGLEPYTLAEGGMRFNPAAGTITENPKAEVQKPVADREIDTFTSKDGFRVTTYQKPDGTTYEVKGLTKVQPPASAVNSAGGFADLSQKQKEQVDAVAKKVAAGEFTVQQGLSALGGTRGGLGGALTEALADTRVLPTAVRTQLSDIDRAKNLLVPVRDLVGEINKTKDLAQKAILSARLENYVQSIGTQFARARGERGVVTDRDVSRVLGLIPGWKAANFAPKWAEDNLKLIEDAFSRDQNSILKNYFNERSIQDSGSPNATFPGAPPIGTIVNGFKFKGGNPNDKANWTK